MARAWTLHDPSAVVWVRKTKGLTQAQLAQAVGVSAGHMSEVESGTRNTTPDVLARIAKVLDCPVGMLKRREAGGAA